MRKLTEAKLFQSQKDNMGLSCLIGGSALERLAFELRLEYCLGEFGTLSAWQVRNCILRKGKRPWKSANFVKPFFDVLNAFSTLRVDSVKKFDKLEEQFLLIDCTVYSPVMQVRFFQHPSFLGERSNAYLHTNFTGKSSFSLCKF